MSYNGWSNWHTWNFKLWMDNDEGNHRHIMRRVADCEDVASTSRFLRDFADQIADEILGKNASFITDYVNDGLNQIDFDEIAETYREELE